MTAALCFDGLEDERLVEAAKPFLAAYPKIESWCAYGDIAERTLAIAVGRHHGSHPEPPDHESLDAEQATAIADRGVELLARAGFTAIARTLAGRDPGHALAHATRPDVVLLIAAGHREESGPRSVGHIARFVIDHAKGPVFVLRLALLERMR
jgi:nucleotide-binding universal stress UspA family protein